MASPLPVAARPAAARGSAASARPSGSRPGRGGWSRRHPQHQPHVLGHEVVADDARPCARSQRPRRGVQDPPALLLGQRRGPEPLGDDVEEALVGGLHPGGAVEVVRERPARRPRPSTTPRSAPSRRGCPRRSRAPAPPWSESAGTACPCRPRRGARSPRRRRPARPRRTRSARHRGRACGFGLRRPATGGRRASIAPILSPVRHRAGICRCVGGVRPRRSVRGPMAVVAPIDERPWLDELNAEQRAAATHAGGPLLILAGAGTGQDDDAVRAGRVAGRRGRTVGADPAADVHAPRGARDAAARARPGARVVARARRHVPLGRPPARAPARRGARAAGRLRRARRGRRRRRARPAARGARARAVAHALPAQGHAAGHLLAHGQRAAAAVGRDRGALPVVRGAPRGDLGAVQGLHGAQARARAWPTSTICCCSGARWRATR